MPKVESLDALEKLTPEAVYGTLRQQGAYRFPPEMVKPLNDAIIRTHESPIARRLIRAHMGQSDHKVEILPIVQGHLQAHLGSGTRIGWSPNATLYVDGRIESSINRLADQIINAAIAHYVTSESPKTHGNVKVIAAALHAPSKGQRSCSDTVARVTTFAHDDAPEALLPQMQQNLQDAVQLKKTIMSQLKRSVPRTTKAKIYFTTESPECDRPVTCTTSDSRRKFGSLRKDIERAFRLIEQRQGSVEEAERAASEHNAAAAREALASAQLSLRRRVRRIREFLAPLGPA